MRTPNWHCFLQALWASWRSGRSLKIVGFSEVIAQRGHKEMHRFSCRGGCHGWQQFLLQRWLSLCTSFSQLRELLPLSERCDSEKYQAHFGDIVPQRSDGRVLLSQTSTQFVCKCKSVNSDSWRMALGTGDLGGGVLGAMGKGNSLRPPHARCRDA